MVTCSGKSSKQQWYFSFRNGTLLQFCKCRKITASQRSHRQWVDLKEENALNHTPSGESIIDQMIELEGTSVCQSIAEEDKMCKDMRKIEDPFVTDTKFKRLGGTFRRF